MKGVGLVLGAVGQVPCEPDTGGPQLAVGAISRCKSPLDSAHGEGLQSAKGEKVACRSVLRPYEPLGSDFLRNGNDLTVLIGQSAALNQAIDGAM